MRSRSIRPDDGPVGRAVGDKPHPLSTTSSNRPRRKMIVSVGAVGMVLLFSAVALPRCDGSPLQSDFSAVTERPTFCWPARKRL